MKAKRVVRHLTLGALITGLVPLTAGRAGAGPASDPAALCRSTFGERGPAGGPVVGEAPSGDPMGVTIDWHPEDWSDGLRAIVTCISVGGHAVLTMTRTTVTPPNTGLLAINFALPPGEPGSLVCEQSILVGSGGTEGRHRPTGPACFKLRAAEPEPPVGPVDRPTAGPPAPVPGRQPTAAGPAGPAGPVAGGPPAIIPAPAPPTAAGPPARIPPALPAAGRGQPLPLPPVSAAPGRAPVLETPGGRAAFEVPRGGRELPIPPAAPAAPAARSGAAVAATPAPGVPARRSASAALPGAAGTAGTTVAAAAGTNGAGAPATALARTGLDHHVPLAGAGGLLALGGAAIVLGEPRRRSRRA